MAIQLTLADKDESVDRTAGGPPGAPIRLLTRLVGEDRVVENRTVTYADIQVGDEVCLGGPNPCFNLVSAVATV